MLYENASFCSFAASNCASTLPGMSANGPAEERLANLKHLLEHRFKGRIANLGRAIDRSDAYLWQLLNGKRNLGERIARYIEGKLGLPVGALDASGNTAEQPKAPYGLSGKQELVLELFGGLFSAQQLEILREMRALFDANRLIIKELGQQPLRGVSDAQIEAAFGRVPVHGKRPKKRPRGPGRELGTAMDDFLEPE